MDHALFFIDPPVCGVYFAIGVRSASCPRPLSNVYIVDRFIYFIVTKLIMCSQIEMLPKLICRLHVCV